MVLPGTHSCNQPFTLPPNEGRTAAIAFTAHPLQGRTIRRWVETQLQPVVVNRINSICRTTQFMIDALHAIDAVAVVATSKQQDILPLLVGVFIHTKWTEATYWCDKFYEREVDRSRWPACLVRMWNDL